MAHARRLSVQGKMKHINLVSGSENLLDNLENMEIADNYLNSADNAASPKGWERRRLNANEVGIRHNIMQLTN